jgi:hypothetical protein
VKLEIYGERKYLYSELKDVAEIKQDMVANKENKDYISKILTHKLTARLYRALYSIRPEYPTTEDLRGSENNG